VACTRLRLPIAAFIAVLACDFLSSPLRSQSLPVITSFAASAPVTNPGTVTNLSWSVANATSISIDQGVGDVTGTNSIYVGPVLTTTYTLTAAAGANSVTRQVTVTVADTPAPVFGNGRTYYVSPSGSDSNSGLAAGSPWQTVAKVNSTSLQPGDTVLFQRGGEWHESLTAPSSGVAGNPISFADYGTGVKPKFWGSIVLTNSLFVPAGNGLYTYSISTPITAALVNHTFFYTSPSNNAAALVNSWSYSGTTLTINSPNSDPRIDGNVYTAVVRQDVVFSNYQSHLIFRNLVADESAAADQGYAFRIQNSTDVLVDSCEAYRAGKHHFASINSTQFVGKNLYAAWSMPGQSRVGATSVDPAVSAYVSYGDSSVSLPNQTSEWSNVVWDHPIDPQNNVNYYAFYTHGAKVTSVFLENMSSLAAGLTVNNSDNTSATIFIKGGLIQNARLEVYGQGILVDGMHITGPYGSALMGGAGLTFQNMLLEGSYLEADGYQTAVVSRASGNTLRFSTIVLDSRASGSYACLTLDSDFSGTSSQGAHFQYYGNVCIAPMTALKQWDLYAAGADFAQTQYNLYAPGAAFAQASSSGFNYLSFNQWQGLGMDTSSRQGDPLFVGASQSNYNLQPGSPAIDSALLPVSLLIATPPIPTDQADNPRLQGNAFDIGALESPGALNSPNWSITAVGGTPQSTTVGARFGAALQAKVMDSDGNPVIGVSVTFSAPVNGVSAAFNGPTTATSVTDATGVATSPALNANSQQGSYIVAATTAGMAATASFNLTNNPVGVSGTLSGAITSSATAVNLTTEGTADWVHWGDASLNRKAVVGAQISSYTIVGSGSVLKYSNDPRPLSWTDGSPTALGSSNKDGVYISGTGNGFSISVPADTATRTFVLHVGGWDSGGTLTAHLSDGSATDFVNTTAAASGQYDRNYTLTYQAGAAGQQLTVTWKMASGAGNVTLNGAALSSTSVTPASIVATGGTLQTATINSAFPSSLQVTVKDASNNPISGVAVTFTAPSSGASGAFSGSAAATVNTDVGGVATAPVFTANAIAGSYTVVAGTPGLATTASVSLTNQPGAPASISAAGGTPQSATINSSFANPLVAMVKDSGGNPVSGVTVTFAAPSSGASGTFSAGSVTANVMTIGNGTATVLAFTANGQAAAYAVTASAAGIGTPAIFNLTNNALVTGSLMGSADSAKTAVSLTVEGASDWVHWGDTNLNRKAGVTAQLSNYTVGSGSVLKYSNDPRPLSWTGGAPTANSTNNFNGLYISGTGKGFSITAPADSTSRTIVMHVGGWNSGGMFTAHLSDGSATDFTNTTPTATGQYDRNYTLTYRAGSQNQTLTVTWKMASGTGNVTLNAAALAP
jgi:hypothetical protein